MITNILFFVTLAFFLLFSLGLVVALCCPREERYVVKQSAVCLLAILIAMTALAGFLGK